MRYALHVGIDPRNSTAIDRAKRWVEGSDPNYDYRVFMDGDSFEEWGEEFDPALGHSHKHMVVTYNAKGDTDAQAVGRVIADALVRRGVADSQASAGGARFWVVSSAHVWSAQIDRYGQRREGSEADWADHHKHYREEE